MNTVVQVLGWSLLLLGGVFTVITGIGLHRFADSYARLHVAGKAATLGVVATLVGAAALLEDTGGSLRLLLAGAFLLVTTPAGAQALAGSSYRGNVPMSDETRHVAVDEG